MILFEKGRMDRINKPLGNYYPGIVEQKQTGHKFRWSSMILGWNFGIHKLTA